MTSETKTAKTDKRAKKPARQKADKAQFQRFVEAARQIGVNEDPEALDRAFDKVVPRKPPVGT
jgi:hypothetical protein